MTKPHSLGKAENTSTNSELLRVVAVTIVATFAIGVIAISGMS